MMLNIFIVVTGLMLIALFSTFEAAFVSSDPLKIYVQVRNRKKLQQFIAFFQNPGRIINSLIVMINVVDITIAIFVLKSFREYFPILEAGLYATIFTISVTLIFGEIIPKGIALAFPQFIILHFFFIIRIFIILSRPMVLLVDTVSGFFFKKLRKERGNTPIARSDIELLFHQNGKFQSQRLVEMVYHVLSIDDIRVKETKIPISEVVGFSKNTTVRNFQKELAQEYYARIPIYDEDIFDIVGYVNSKDIFFSQDMDDPIEKYGEKAIFFPENKPADEVIESLENEGIPIAFVVDEFGAVSGMVTKNNLVEIIVGGAAHDDQGRSRGLFTMSQDGWIVSGRQDVDELNDRLGLGIQKDGFETLAGFIMSHFRDIPSVGDFFVFNSFVYNVKEMQKFVIAKVEISKYLPTEDREDSENS